MFPCALVLGVFAGPLLTIWIGAEAAAQGERVLQLYLLYVFINSLSYPAAMLLLGIGKPHISAIIQLVGFPIYVAAVCLVVPQFGIAGAAAVSVARVALDTLAHFYFVRRVFGSLGRESLPVFVSSAAASALLVVSCISSDFWPLVLAAGLGGGLIGTWFWILTDQDKVWIYKQYAARPRGSV
jgi:O-antigen/teichoic acid export membrane protein